MEQDRFSLIERLKSFRHAFNGLKILISEEHNSRIHLAAALLAIAAGIVLRISLFKWVAVVFAIGFVFTAEIFNSAVEKMADFTTREQLEPIKKIKDLAAAAVLISAITALVIGLLVFIPEIAGLF